MTNHMKRAGTVSLIALVGALAMTTQAAAQATNADDIIVTARKTAENVQDISATIDVLSAATLDKSGINSLENIEGQVPGLQFGNTGFNGAQIGLRGISSQRAFTGDEAAVAVHIDGVFQPQSGQALARMFDVERIEVLKGPQGTLYGRNANAGVINIITKAPGDTMEGYAQASYGSFETMRAEGAITVPLGENQGLRIAGIFANGDGYIKNRSPETPGVARTLGKDDYWGARLRYAGEWGESLKVDAGFQYIRDNSTRDQAQSYSTVGFYEGFFDSPASTKRDDMNYFVQFDLDLGGVGLRSLTGGSAFDNEFRVDARNSSTAFVDNNGANDGWSLSEELTLYGKNSDTLDWRLGLFYQYSDLAEQRRAAGLLDGNYYIFQDFDLTQKGNAYAAFADVTWNASDKLSINIGGRYNYETKNQTQFEVHSEDAFGAGSGAPPGPGGPLDCSVAYGPTTFPLAACSSSDTQKYSWDGFTGRVGIDYRATENLLLYASYARGFRSGAVGGQVGTDNFFDAIFGGPGTFGLVKLDEEKVDNFEVGIKSELLDNRVTLNIAGFYAKFKNMLFTIADPETFRFVEGNLGNAEVKGIDFLVVVRPTQGLRWTMNGEYLETEVTDAPPPGFFFGVPAIREGNELPRAPRVSLSTSLDYTFAVGGAGEMNLFSEYTFKDDHFFDLSNTTQQKSFGLLNLSARFNSAAGWYVFANGRNVLDKRYLLNGGPTIANPARPSLQRPGMPATFEAGIGFRF